MVFTVPVPGASVNGSFVGDCVQNTKSLFIFGSWFLTKNAVMVPLCVFILRFGFQQWRRGALGKASNCDLFVYNLCVLELASCAGGVVYFSGQLSKCWVLLAAGSVPFFVIIPVETLTHLLSCVDMFVAVVRPVLYLKSRQQSGVRIRNVSMAGVWAAGFSIAGIVNFILPTDRDAMWLPFLAFNLSVIYFCELAVLRVLLRRGPGGKVDRAKRRAFHKILWLAVTTSVWFTAFSACLLLLKSAALGFEDSCVLSVSVCWFSFPCSLASPVIFLQKHRKVLLRRGKPRGVSTGRPGGEQVTTGV